jgi:hypothetical protein
MRLIITAVGVAVVSLTFVASAEAQVGSTTLGAPGAGTVVVRETVVGSPVLTVTPTSYSYVGPIASSPPVILPYSYYVLAPMPSRIYLPYGATDQFPFQGRAYGNPSDRWSWYYMGGGPSRYLARYYYPPLR